MTTAYPLAWPEGWPRTPPEKRQDSKYRFGRNQHAGRTLWTFAAARDALGEELDRLNAREVILSTNFELNLSGQPRGDRARRADQGIAVYFKLKGQPRVMACDMHQRAEENMRSVALAIEAMRQLERHGGGLMMEKAFAGFTALPAPKRPHEILGVEPTASADEVRRAWRSKIAGAHPDQGGNQADAAAINAARDAMLKEPA